MQVEEEGTASIAPEDGNGEDVVALQADEPPLVKMLPTPETPSMLAKKCHRNWMRMQCTSRGITLRFLPRKASRKSWGLLRTP